MKLRHSVTCGLVGLAFSVASPSLLAMPMASDMSLDYDGPGGDAPIIASSACGPIAGSGPGGNIIVDDANSCFGPSWTEVIGNVDAGSGGSGSGALEGITFSIDALTFQTTGTFLFSWEADPESLLPAIADLAFGLKGGSAEGALYLFDDFDLINEGGGAGDANGTYEITFENNGGQIPALSNLDLYVRDIVCCGDLPPDPDPNPMPLPGTLLLIGLGLLAQGVVRKRKA